MRILISGVTGFVGRHFLPELIGKGSDVEILTISRDKDKATSTFRQATNCIHCSVDEMNEAVVKFQPEIVFHLASKVTSKNDDDTVDELLRSNIDFGVKLLQVINKCHPPILFVNLGTFAEYRMGPGEVNNAYIYSATKTAFKAILDYYSNFKKYNYIHIAPYTIYGGNDSQKKVIDHIIDSFNAVEPVNMSKGEQILDFIHIKDVVSFFLYIINNMSKFSKQPNGEVYHLGTGKGHSIRELAKLLEDFHGKKCNINWGALPYRDMDVMHAVSPIATLLNLGWKPLISLYDGIRLK